LSLPRFHGTDLVFPSRTGGPLSDTALLMVLRGMNVDAVPHGFRATFKTWAEEQTNFHRNVIEASLAHTLGDKVEEAYMSGDLIEKRRDLMDAWAAFCQSPERELVTQR
jgi:integrase